MILIGVDYHPSVQQVAWVETETGECDERQPTHSDGEAEKFYRGLQRRGFSVRVGMEATRHARWFERLLSELGFELWIGDPAQIRAKRVRKQKTDRQDAQLLLTLLVENRFPRVWVPSLNNRDLRQLLWHRHRLVQMRTRIMNQLQAVAMNEGVRRRKKLWSVAGRRATTAGFVGAAGPINREHRPVKRSHRAGSRETVRGATPDDTSWRRPSHGARLRADHRDSKALFLAESR